MTTVSFTNDLSGAIAFAGTVKIKCDDIPQGGSVEIHEERTDGNYELASTEWGVIGYPERNRLLELRGNYKIKRSHSAIAVGYEA